MFGVLFFIDDGIFLYKVILLKFEVLKVYEVILDWLMNGMEVVLFVFGDMMLENEVKFLKLVELEVIDVICVWLVFYEG